MKGMRNETLRFDYGSIAPEKVAKKALRILNKRAPRFSYSINRNPLLLLLNALPRRTQLWVIKQVLKTKEKGSSKLNSPHRQKRDEELLKFPVLFFAFFTSTASASTKAVLALWICCCFAWLDIFALRQIQYDINPRRLIYIDAYLLFLLVFLDKNGALVAPVSLYRRA